MKQINNLPDKEFKALVIRMVTATQKKSPESDGFNEEVYQTYKKKLMLIFFKCFQNIEEEGILPKSLYESTLTLIPKPEVNTTKNKKEEEREKITSSIFDE